LFLHKEKAVLGLHKEKAVLGRLWILNWWRRGESNPIPYMPLISH